MTRTPILISIEANIGAGKSTVLQKLQEILDPTLISCIEEPIDIWNQYRDESGRTLLELYYTNPAKYALALQTMIYNSLKRTIYLNISTTFIPMILTERSLQSSSGIFGKMLLDCGVMTPIEHQVYENCVAADPIPLDACIYLRTDPDICYERIRHRNRHGEQKIDIDYLLSCHAAHETWIAGLKNTRVFVVEVGVKTPSQVLVEVLMILENLAN